MGLPDLIGRMKQLSSVMAPSKSCWMSAGGIHPWQGHREEGMLKGGLLWMMGVPLIVVIVLLVIGVI